MILGEQPLRIWQKFISCSEKRAIFSILYELWALWLRRPKKNLKKTDLVRFIVEENSVLHPTGRSPLNSSLLASIFHIARSSVRYVSRMMKWDEERRKQMTAVHGEHPFYGHRRLAWTLGWSYNKVRRLMHKFGIFAQRRKRKSFIKSGDIGKTDMHTQWIKNWMKYICPIAPNSVWRTDFTHIIFHGVHLYLATILDDFTKEIIGYSLAFHHTKEFTLEALKNAIKASWILPHYLHSDQGSEYTSFLFLQYLAQHKITLSMSSKGSPWQNWAQESYYGKFKLELGSPNNYDSIESLILAIHQRIYYYNHKRLHTALKDTPCWFKEKYLKKHSKKKSIQECSET